jgi:hypothetical protein
VCLLNCTCFLAEELAVLWQVDAAHAVTDAAMARIAEIEQYLEATGAEVIPF